MIKRLSSFFDPHKTKNLLWGILVLSVISYGVTYLVPRQVEFSYGGETCQRQMTFLPAIHSSVDKSYGVSFNESLRIGEVDVLSMRTCFEPKTSPKVGETIVGTSPWNGFLARTLYKVAVTKPPQVQLASVRPELPVTKPLVVPMSAQDTIHEFVLNVDEGNAPCVPHSDGLLCDIPLLKLDQGKKYDYSIMKSFNGKEGSRVAASSFTTLRAITVTDGSVKPDQMVYARPKSFSFTTDKPIGSAEVGLSVEGKEVEVSQRIEGATLTLGIKEELPREKNVELTLKKLDAKDGSTLIEPYVVKFSTSGGPKVANVSVANTGVPQSAAIVLTFDQPLSKTKDVLPLIGVTGGQASVQKRSDTQVVVQLGNLPLCQPFSVALKPGIMSEHDVASTKAWQFDARTTCFATVSYGTSLKGRPLTAYIFGSSGPVTMYVGGIHGNESSSTGLMRAWISQLEANPSRIAGKRIVVIPVINPDGLASGTRANSRGVNLNRNFPTDNWTKSINDTDGTHPNGGGDAPLSEPEAKALAAITNTYRPRLLLSFHAVGSIVIGDPGGYSAGYAARYASMVGYRDGTNSSPTNFDYNVTGAYEDWTYRNQGIPSMVIELSNYGSVYAAGHYPALWAMLN
jgi:predicted deacylase